MRNSVDVVIPMQLNSNFTLLYPVQVDWEKFTAYRPDIPFSDEVIEFLNILSGGILKESSLSRCDYVCFFLQKGKSAKIEG